MQAFSANAEEACFFSQGPFYSVRLNAGNGSTLPIRVSRTPQNIGDLKNLCDETLRASHCVLNPGSEFTLFYVGELPEWILQFAGPVPSVGFNRMFDSFEECETHRSWFSIRATGRAQDAIALRPEEQRQIEDRKWGTRLR